MNKAIQLSKEEEVSLVQYGSRNAARELGDRLRLTMPSAQAFTDDEALAVAQIALAHDLDPFNGEVWGIKGQDGKWYGVMVGVKGLRKSSNKHAKKENTTYWIEYQFPADVSPYTATKTDKVCLAYLRDSARVQAWASSIHSLTSVGVPYAEAVTMLGPAPVVVGVGISNPGERSKMRLDARAKKRAEADALKQRFDVEFGGAIQADFDPDDGESVEFTPLKSVVAQQTEEQLMAGLGFEPDPVSASYVPSDPNPYMGEEFEAEVVTIGEYFEDAWDEDAIQTLASAKVGINNPDTVREVLAMSQFVHPGMKMEYLKRWVNKVALNRKAGIPREEAVNQADSFIADLVSNEK